VFEGESVEFTGIMRSNYDYYYSNETGWFYNYTKFVYYVWWSDRDGVIASGNISSDDLGYGNDEDHNDTDDTECCHQYFENIVEVDDLSAGGHEISFWVMNEYGGWTQYCQNYGCPLQIAVVGEGDSVPEAEVDFAAQVEACLTPWVNDDADWNDCDKDRYSDYDNDTEFVYSNFIENYPIYFEGDVSDDDGNLEINRVIFYEIGIYKFRIIIII
jgi:hypothetical protein